jgi:hypothetical protein
MDPQARFQECLRDVLRFTDRQVEVLIGDGYELPDDLAYWSYDDIKSWVSHKEKLPRTAAGGGVLYGDMKRKNLSALAWWVTERVRTGQVVNLDDFDDEARRMAVVEARVEYDDSASEQVSIDKPKRFKYEEWPEWEKSVYTYLLSVKNSLGIPLAYVIRKPTLDHELDPRTRALINNATHTGALFRADSQTVLSLLKSLTTGTDAENWIQGVTCGKSAMKALQDHYDGDAEAEKRKQAAKSDLHVLFYRHEAAFSFEKYINRMKRCFDILEKYGVPYYEEDKVRLLLDRIQNNHGEVKTQVSICRANHAGSFVEASTYLSREISRIFPSSNVSSTQFGKGKPRRSVASARTSNGKRKGRIVEKNNGVDISDVTRYFSPEEWKKLDPDIRRKILDHPERKKRRTNAANKSRSVSSATVTDSSNSTVSSGLDKESEDRIVAAVLRGVMESSKTDGDNRAGTILPVVPQHGSRAISSAQSTSGSVQSRTSSVTFEPSVSFRRS